jgi:cyanate lyase|tara:strand:+ start:148 stop:276 length:129 start_codon:yes stop_codon:yes gene_type:complete
VYNTDVKQITIDFTMEVDKIEDPKGDRVLLTLNGKFLPYKSW